MSSPFDRIEDAVLDAIDAGGDFRYEPVGKAGLAALEALVNVAKAAEEAARLSRPTEAQMHALREALAMLDKADNK